MKPAQQLAQAGRHLASQLSDQKIQNILQQPVFILSAPRSGSTLLYELLSRQATFWSIGGESHIAYASMPHLRFENRQMDSACLNAGHADPDTRSLFRAELLYLAQDRGGVPYVKLGENQRPNDICLLEKTPRNALNLPFLDCVFPDAKYVYLRRDARQNIASIMQGWQLGLETGRFATYHDLPEWDRKNWCFLLPSNWRSMRGKSLAEIAAFQWAESNKCILTGLKTLPAQRSLCIDYQSLLDAPASTLAKISQFAGVDYNPELKNSDPLPLSATATSKPDPDKWKTHKALIEQQLSGLVGLNEAIDAFFKLHS